MPAVLAVRGAGRSCIYIQTSLSCSSWASPDLCLPVQAGGAINVGFDSFSAAGSCSAEDQATFSSVEVDQCLFQGNLATDHGGAIGVQSGTLQLTVRGLTQSCECVCVCVCV